MKKVSKTKIARIYAKSLFDVSVKEKKLDAIYSLVQDFMLLISADSSFVANISNPIWLYTQKQKEISVICKKLKCPKFLQTFIEVVTQNDRAYCLEEIFREFEHLYYVSKNIEEVNVETAVPLTKLQEKKLITNMEKLLNKKVVISYEVKPQLLGGLVITYDSKMIDDSLSGKIDRLLIAMKG